MRREESRHEKRERQGKEEGNKSYHEQCEKNRAILEKLSYNLSQASIKGVSE